MNDNEVRALLAIWAYATIQRQLLGAVQNMTVFSRITDELVRKGYQHDTKQCLEKLKQLTRKYMEVVDGFVTAEMEWTLTMTSKNAASL